MWDARPGHRKGEGCFGYDMFFDRKVKLAPGARHLRLLDGSADPPLRRWPPPVETGRSFCSKPDPCDYAEPLKRLPKIRRIAKPPSPAGRSLPFGAKGIELHIDALPVVVGSGQFGIAFNGNFEDEPRVDWTISAQLHPFHRGVLGPEIDHGGVQIEKLGPLYPSSLNLQVPGRPGFYRFDVQFADSEGHPLGAFAEYLRVVPRSVNAKLAINGWWFRPGQEVAFRIENPGTDPASYGDPYSVEHWQEGRWQEVLRLTPDAWLLYAGIAYAGWAGRCQGLTIPRDLRAGRYRVSKYVKVETASKAWKGSTLIAPFWVGSH